jgi:protein-S-isoprenylcysteine O-methyltransferase Ste14
VWPIQARSVYADGLEKEPKMRRTERGHRASARIVEVAILIALPVLLHYLTPIIILVPRPYSYLGALVMLLGLAFMTWAAMLFRQVGTSFQLQGESSSLVTSGPFHLSRNPIYLGMLIWLIGLAILLGSLIAFVFPLVFFMLANFYVVPLEEKSMEQMFGKQFIEYKRHVRRWL